jgi:hypothetical protein
LEQLRKLNNELEEAHLALEVKLYQELDIKDQLISEISARFKQQSGNLNMQSEAIKKMQKKIDSYAAKLENQNNFSKIKTDMIQKLQNLRICEASLETLKTRLQIETMHKNIAAGEVGVFKV